MPYLMCQRQLRHLRRHPAVIIHKRNNPRIKRPLRRLVHPSDRFRVSLVPLANTTRSTRCTRDPRQTQSASGKITVREDVRQAEIFVVTERMDVQVVADVNVLQAELVDVVTVTTVALT